MKTVATGPTDERVAVSYMPRHPGDGPAKLFTHILDHACQADIEGRRRYGPLPITIVAQDPVS